MRAMILDNVHFVPQNTVFLMFGHVVNAGAGKRRGLLVIVVLG